MSLHQGTVLMLYLARIKFLILMSYILQSYIVNRNIGVGGGVCACEGGGGCVCVCVCNI